MIEDDIASPSLSFSSFFLSAGNPCLPFFSPLFSTITSWTVPGNLEGGHPSNPRIERVFFEVGEIVEIVKKERKEKNTRTRRDFYRGQMFGREGGKAFFFFCGGKGAYAAGLPTDLAKPIDQLDAVGIRPRWMTKRGRD